jgi:hypothetical protein
MSVREERGLRARSVSIVMSVIFIAVALTIPAAARSTSPSPLARERTSNTYPHWHTLFGPDGLAGCRVPKASSFELRLTGNAEGPFPGRYRERGTFEVGPADREVLNGWGVTSSAGPVVSWRTRFTIWSDTARVEGRMWLDPARRRASYGECGSFVDQPVLIGEPGWRLTGWDIRVFARVRYRATITTAAGSKIARGRALVEAGVGRAHATACPYPNCSGGSGFVGGGDIFDRKD